MHALVELIDRFRPGFAARVAPASIDIVEQLEALAGPIPGAYRRFLQVMGGDMAGFIPLDADFNVEDRLLNYQLDDRLRGSSDLLVAAGGILEPGGSLFMDRELPSAEDDCLLLVNPSGDPGQLDQRFPLHVGLEEFLYVEAYREVRLPLCPMRTELTPSGAAEPDAAMIDMVIDLTHRLGFARMPPARRSALFERGDAAMVLYRHPFLNAFSFQLGASDAFELQRMTDIYRGQVPLQTLG